MTPILSNPESEQLRTLRLSAPFNGVYRRGPLQRDEGVIYELDQCAIEDGIIKTLPCFSSTNKTTSAMPWMTGIERIQGYIEGLDARPYMLFTNERVHEHDFTALPITYFTIGDTWTKAAPSQQVTATISGIVSPDSGAYHTMISPNSGVTWYTVTDFVTGPPDTIVVAETAGSFAAATLLVAFQNFTDNTVCWYGPRYCYLGSNLILCGKYATYYRPAGGLFAALTNIYRGRDVVNFAGRPILIGAVEASAGYNATPTPGLDSDLLRWPTRGDYTDWSSYGSGFLNTQDDGGNHRAGCVWGEDAYLFTSAAIYRLIETGQSAANPIAIRKFPVKNYDPPISNVVQGRRGLYYWSVRGPVLFNGQDIIPLYDLLEKDPLVYGTDLNAEGVFVWTDKYSQTVRFYNKRQHTNLLRYIYWEKNNAFTTLDSSTMYLAGLPEYNRTSYWGIDVQDLQPPPAAAVPVSRLLNESTGTLNEAGDAFDYSQVYIRGITFPEGGQVNKIPRFVRLLGIFKTSSTDRLGAGMHPDKSGLGVTPGYVDVTGSTGLQQVVIEIPESYEAPVWALRIDMYERCEIHEIYIDYNLGSSTQHWDYS